MVFNIIYVSKALHPLNNEALLLLLEQSRSWNAQYSITGMLLYVEREAPGQAAGRFMQVIEGHENDIKLLFDKIKADSRHHQVTPLHEGHINKRNFKRWSMGFKRTSEDFLIKDGYIDFDEVFINSKRQPKFNIALNYLKSFYDMNL